MGELIDAIVTEVETATSNQLNSEVVIDTDVPAQAGQAEDGGYRTELIMPLDFNNGR